MHIIFANNLIKKTHTMSTMIRKNLNLKSFRCFKFFFWNSNKGYNYTHFRNPSLLCSVSRQQHFTSVAANYNVSKTREKSEFQNSGDAILKDIDDSFIELDYAIKRTGRVGKKSLEDVLSLIDKVGSASMLHGLYLIRCCGLLRGEPPALRVQLANTVWKKLNELGIQLEAKHFNALLKVWVENNYEFSPAEFLESMENCKIEPNKVTYMLLMEKYCNEGNLTGASEILQSLKDTGTALNESVFNILIKGHMRANDISGSKDILDVMRSSNLSPTVESYRALACGYAERGSIADVKSVLEEAQNNNIQLSNTDYLSIVSSLSDKPDNIKFANEVLLKMRDLPDWRQDIVNSMLDLVCKGSDEIAYQLLLSVADSGNTYSISFVRQLVRCGSPTDKVIRYCEEIQDQGIHNYAFINAAKTAIEEGRFDLAFASFEGLQRKGIPVRTHNLYPLLSCYRNSEEGLLKTLEKMFQLGVPADHIAYVEYVFPAISKFSSSPEAVLSKIEKTGQSIIGASGSLFQYYSENGDFENALYLAEKFPIHVHPNINFRSCISYFKDNKNNLAFLKVISFLLKNIGYPGHEREAFAGKNLAVLLQTNPTLFDAVLNVEHEFSKQSIEFCANILREQSPNLLGYLRKLKSNGNFFNNNRARSIIEKEKELMLLKEKGMPTGQLLLEHLSFHLKAKNILKVRELKEELDKQGVEFPPVLCAQLLSFYCEINNLEATEQYFQHLKTRYPDFKIDSVKILHYAALLIKVSKFDDAVNLITNECQELFFFGNTDMMIRSLKIFLNVVVETGNYDLIKKIQNCLLCHTKALKSEVFYEPLVKYHLYKNDFDSAMMEFEACVKNHQMAPCLQTLLKKFIIYENHEKLERVIETSAALNGKKASYYELLLAFLETGRKSQAAKLLQNLENRTDSGYLEDICARFYKQNRVSDLHEIITFVCATKNIDGEKLFYQLFTLADEKNDFKTALDLYNVAANFFEISNETKQLLAKLLSRNKQPLPFTVPEGTLDSYDILPMDRESVPKFLECVKEGDAYKALEKLQNMKKGIVRSLTLNDVTEFLDLSIRKGILNDVALNVPLMSYILDNARVILKPLLEKYSLSGDVNSLNEISKVFPNSLKKISFNAHYSKAFISNEKYDDLVSELEEHCYEKNKLFSVLGFQELLKVPHLEDRVINLAQKYSEQNFHLPNAVVWAHYLTHENYEKADEFCKMHSVQADLVDVTVLKIVRQQENVTMGKMYLKAIGGLNARNRCKERAYGTLLDLLVLKGMHDDATALIAEAKEKGIILEKYYRPTLITLKNALEREKKDVPFNILSHGYTLLN